MAEELRHLRGAEGLSCTQGLSTAFDPNQTLIARCTSGASVSDCRVALRARDLALCDLALDSKLRGCDLVALKVSDLISASGVRTRVMILQRKTGRPVQFEVTEQTRRSIASWIEKKKLTPGDWLFPSRSKRGLI